MVGMSTVSRESSDEMLRGWAQWFRIAFEPSPVCTGLLGADGRVLLVNTSMLRVPGYSREELLGRSFNGITYPHDRGLSERVFRGLFCGETDGFQIERRYLHKDGRIVWGLLSVSVVHDAAGSPVHALAQFQDITEHKHAQAALRESESTLQSILKAAPMGIGLVRARVRLGECSDARNAGLYGAGASWPGHAYGLPDR